MTGNRWPHGVAVALVLVLVASACGGSGSDTSTRGSSARSKGYSALAANFDLAAGRPQALLVGLVAPDGESVAYGSVRLALRFTGAPGHPLDQPRRGPEVTASFRPVSGSRPYAARGGAREVTTSQAVGVYASEPVTLPDAGFWEMTATFSIAGHTHAASAAFEVLARHRIPAEGDRAIGSRNPVVGEAGVTPTAIDSRAGAAGSIPDPELHAITVASALAARRPVTVVISTPAFCESRFCGPVTDAVAAAAKRHLDRMDFVHIEVWADYQAHRMSPAAAEWIRRDGADGNEPWVFVIDAEGVIRRRFDNAANERVVEEAVQQLLG